MNLVHITERKHERLHPPAGLKVHAPGETRCSAGEHSTLNFYRCWHSKKNVWVTPRITPKTLLTP